ncbi:hypothetical protein IFO70_22235 [Phormidium tenue FACHB-886]|nr:hypothetical protein [Phormidium tenue FACHB-886]
MNDMVEAAIKDKRLTANTLDDRNCLNALIKQIPAQIENGSGMRVGTARAE